MNAGAQLMFFHTLLKCVLCMRVLEPVQGPQSLEEDVRCPFLLFSVLFP